MSSVNPLPGNYPAGSVIDTSLASKIVKRVAQPAQVGVSYINAMANLDTLTITNGLGGGALISETYEFLEDIGDLSLGNIAVVLTTTPGADFLAELAAHSVLARGIIVVGDDSAERAQLIALTAGTAGNAYTIATTGHGSPDAATFSGGLDATVRQTVSIEHVLLAIEATEGICVIGLPFDATFVLLTMRDSTGVRIDDIVVDTTDADSIVISEGATAWGAGGSVTLYAEG